MSNEACGTSIAWYLLKTNSNLIAVVPEARIKCSPLPIGTTIPAISITEITGYEAFKPVAPSATKFIEERVQVTVVARTYTDKKAILRLVEKALPNTRATVNGFACDSIRHDVEGPDFDDPTTELYLQSKDFVVRFTR